MFYRIKNKIEKELPRFVKDIDRQYHLYALSPRLFNAIKDFLLRKGKRLRPTLFVMGYLGFTSQPKKNLYTSALAIELLHDFMLVHDDIIDKSSLRRGKPSMHEMFNVSLKRYNDLKFDGQDLALVAGDVMYALAIRAFLAIKESMRRKERALLKFIEAAVHTGAGEFIELLNAIKPSEQITKQDIYKIYDFKTSHYTFATPLASGAILGGAGDTQVNKLIHFGIYLGRAFQLKDDMLGMFGDEKKIGKSTLTDLQEAKHTLLIWHVYNKGDKKDKASITQILSKKKVAHSDLLRVRKIMEALGTPEYIKRDIGLLLGKAKDIIVSTALKQKYKQALFSYAEHLLYLR